MKKYNILIYLILKFNLIINKFINKNDNIIIKKSELKGFYKITSILNENNFFIENDIISLSKDFNIFKIIKIDLDLYYIENTKLNKILSYDDKNNEIIMDDKKEYINKSKNIWNLININKNQYIIRNKSNKKFIKVNNTFLYFSNSFSFNQIQNKTNIQKSFIFSFLKLYEKDKPNKKFLNFVNKEPIDIVIKYIDLTDKKLSRKGIKQIYKDKDNEELRYSTRSIMENIPWIRKIFIIMPNEKVRFFKSSGEIKDKFIYIKDKDFLGYDSANIGAFTINLHKMENFGISKNFIYMDDDYFIGNKLKKIDFFYYDEIDKKVYPYILCLKFKEMNRTDVLINYDELFKDKDQINPHSGNGFSLSILSTEKFFLENYNFSLIKTEPTHNAIGLNIDDLKEIFQLIKKYKYINQTLFSKERYILRLSHQHLVNLYQLNIKHKKIHSIAHKYYSIESLNKVKLFSDLYVLNTGGNHIPLKRQYKFQKKVMEKLFPFPTIYELKIVNKKQIKIGQFLKIIIYKIYLFIILIILKLKVK